MYDIVSSSVISYDISFVMQERPDPVLGGSWLMAHGTFATADCRAQTSDRWGTTKSYEPPSEGLAPYVSTREQDMLKAASVEIP